MNKISEQDNKALKSALTAALIDILATFTIRHFFRLGGLLVERRTCVSQILGSTPGQVAAV